MGASSGHGPSPGITLVLGGARSGKSAYAEALARRCGLARIYVATAESRDAEMATRIARHRADRGADWRTVERPRDLPAVIRSESAPDHVVLVDCLTLWLSNELLADADLTRETERLGEALAAAPGPVIAVSNEVGLSIVPDNALARRFQDAQGRLNQAVAQIAHRVAFVAAGLPLWLKGSEDDSLIAPHHAAPRSIRPDEREEPSR